METNGRGCGTRLPAGTTIHTLIISQHDVVRRQLVAYLSRSPDLHVQGEPFGQDTVDRVRPDVLVLDLGQLAAADVRQAIDAAVRTGAGLIALASMPDIHVERLVREAGGLYRLKAAGADHLTETVREAAVLPSPRASAPQFAGTAMAGLPRRPRRGRQSDTGVTDTGTN